MFFMTKRLLLILGSILLVMIVILLLPVQAPDPGIPTVITLAPVCRPTWLIEMECIAIKECENAQYANF